MQMSVSHIVIISELCMQQLLLQSQEGFFFGFADVVYHHIFLNVD